VRLIGVGLLFALYFGTAWLDWGGRRQCCLIYRLPVPYLASTFPAGDFFLLSFLTDICAFGRFLSPVLAGRIWWRFTPAHRRSGRGIFNVGRKG